MGELFALSAVVITTGLLVWRALRKRSPTLSVPDHLRAVLALPDECDHDKRRGHVLKHAGATDRASLLGPRLQIAYGSYRTWLARTDREHEADREEGARLKRLRKVTSLFERKAASGSS